MYFRKSHVRSKMLDVQETDFSFTQFYRSWNYFSGCRFTYGRISLAWSLGHSDLKYFIPHCMEKAIRESSFRTRLWKSSKLECLFSNGEKGLFFFVYVDDIKPNVESTDERSRFGRANIIRGPRLFGLHSTRLRNKHRYCGQEYVFWIQNLCGSKRKTTLLRKNLLDADISSWSYDIECHAKKCVERYCELANKTTRQLYKVSTPCLDDHHVKEEVKRGRIV